MKHYAQYYEVTAPQDYALFLTALPDLFVDTDLLCLEGARPPEKIDEFLNRHVIRLVKVPGGTVIPRPSHFYVPITRRIVNTLAELIITFSPDGCPEHTHVLRGGKLLLEWCDASASAPMFIASLIGEKAATAFCAAIGSRIVCVPGNDKPFSKCS